MFHVSVTVFEQSTFQLRMTWSCKGGIYVYIHLWPWHYGKHSVILFVRKTLKKLKIWYHSYAQNITYKSTFCTKISLNFVFCMRLAHVFMQPAAVLHPAVGGSILLIYLIDLQISEQCLALSSALHTFSDRVTISPAVPPPRCFTTSSCCICHSSNTCTHANSLLSHRSFMHV